MCICFALFFASPLTAHRSSRIFFLRPLQNGGRLAFLADKKENSYLNSSKVGCIHTNSLLLL